MASVWLALWSHSGFCFLNTCKRIETDLGDCLIGPTPTTAAWEAIKVAWFWLIDLQGSENLMWRSTRSLSLLAAIEYSLTRSNSSGNYTWGCSKNLTLISNKLIVCLHLVLCTFRGCAAWIVRDSVHPRAPFDSYRQQGLEKCWQQSDSCAYKYLIH